jgi:hypothetical protein
VKRVVSPDALTPIEERELNQPADHPAVIRNPDQWRDAFGYAAPAGFFETEREAA